MKRIVALLLATAAATAVPAQAQHDHHDHHDHDVMHREGSDPRAAAPEAGQAADPHAGHSGHENTSQPADPHAGHVMPSPGLTHAAHRAVLPDPPIAQPPPGAFSGPTHAADTVFDPAEMTQARLVVRREHGAIVTGAVIIDRLEAGFGKGHEAYAWKAQAWHGGDIDRLWFKSDGEGSFGEPLERAEVQALWSHALDPWWNLQAGVRQDVGVGPDRTHAALGIHGLAPYWFEVDGTVFLSNRGEVTGRVELSYDQRLTRKLILQPEIELDLAARDMPALGIGAGLSSAKAGLRLRYQIVPEFAPYIGVRHEHAIGDTAAYRRARGEAADSTRFVVGLRAWF